MCFDMLEKGREILKGYKNTSKNTSDNFSNSPTPMQIVMESEVESVKELELQDVESEEDTVSACQQFVEKRCTGHLGKPKVPWSSNTSS